MLSGREMGVLNVPKMCSVGLDGMSEELKINSGGGREGRECTVVVRRHNHGLTHTWIGVIGYTVGTE